MRHALMIFSIAFHTTSSKPILRKFLEVPLRISMMIVSKIWDGISPVSQMCLHNQIHQQTPCVARSL